MLFLVVDVIGFAGQDLVVHIFVGHSIDVFPMAEFPGRPYDYVTTSLKNSISSGSLDLKAAALLLR